MTFTRYSISDPSRRANDGTNYVYYVQPAVGNDVVVYLQGGGFCNGFGQGGEWDCNERTLAQKSSSVWPATLPASQFPYGVLSVDPLENPFFNTATMVFCPYLSSDAWLGTMQDAGSGWYFHGWNIAQGMIQELVTNHGLTTGKRLIFVADSAGAVGLWHNLPAWYESWFATGMPLAGISWYAMPISGWLFDPGLLDPQLDSFQTIIQECINLWSADSWFFGMSEFAGINEWKGLKSLLTYPYIDQAILERLLVVNAIPDAIPVSFSQIDLSYPMPNGEYAFLQGLAGQMATELAAVARVFGVARVNWVDGNGNTVVPLHTMGVTRVFRREKTSCWDLNRALEMLLLGISFKLIEAWDGEIAPLVTTGNGIGEVVQRRLTIYQGVTATLVLEELGVPQFWEQIYWTLKVRRDDNDDDAWVRVVISNPPDVGDGLLLVNGAVAESECLGCLEVRGEKTETVTVRLSPAVTEALSPARFLVWDLEAVAADGVYVIGEGMARVRANQ